MTASVMDNKIKEIDNEIKNVIDRINYISGSSKLVDTKIEQIANNYAQLVELKARRAELEKLYSEWFGR